MTRWRVAPSPFGSPGGRLVIAEVDGRAPLTWACDRGEVEDPRRCREKLAWMAHVVAESERKAVPA